MKDQTKITHHFLGISLDQKIFFGLFNSLQKYFKENNLEDAVRLPNISSWHITLYYFKQELNNSILSKIKNNLLELNKKENLFPIFIDEIGFLKKRGKNYLCYLSPSEKGKLKEIYSATKQNFFSLIPDDNFPEYLPHVTIFRIKNFDLYQPHQEKILSIISTYIKDLQKNNAFVSFNLFSVNSTLSPEKYTIVF